MEVNTLNELTEKEIIYYKSSDSKVDCCNFVDIYEDSIGIQIPNIIKCSSKCNSQSNGTETDPVFSKSPAAQITNLDIENWNSKQNLLVSGEDIKTINNESILGPGNIMIEGGGGVTEEYVQDAIDQTLAQFSEGIAADILNLQTDIYTNVLAIEGKLDSLIDGENIKMINGQSLLGPGNIIIQGGDAIVEETDPVFLAHPAATISEKNIEDWNDNTTYLSGIKNRTTAVPMASSDGNGNNIYHTYATKSSVNNINSDILALQSKIVPVTVEADGLMPKSMLGTNVATKELGNYVEIKHNYNQSYLLIPKATSEIAGVMSPEDKKIVDSVPDRDAQLLEQIQLVESDIKTIISDTIDDVEKDYSKKSNTLRHLTLSSSATANGLSLLLEGEYDDSVQGSHILGPDNIILPYATESKAGVMSPEDKSKLDNIIIGGNVRIDVTPLLTLNPTQDNKLIGCSLVNLTNHILYSSGKDGDLGGPVKFYPTTETTGGNGGDKNSINSFYPAEGYLIQEAIQAYGSSIRVGKWIIKVADSYDSVLQTNCVIVVSGEYREFTM